mgnify:FL=1
MKKAALFVISTKNFQANKPKLSGLDYEAQLSADGKNAYVVVRDCNRYVGDPIAYASQILGQHAVRACC